MTFSTADSLSDSHFNHQLEIAIRYLAIVMGLH